MIKKNIVIFVLILVFLSGNNIGFAKGYTYFSSQDDKFQEIFKKSFDLRFKEDKYEEALEGYRKAYEINPNHMMLLEEMCKCFYDLNNLPELEKYSRKGLLIAQSNVVSKYYVGAFYRHLADYYRLDKKFDLAIKYYNLSILNDPYNKDTFLSIAYCFEMLQKYDEASNFYKRVEVLDSKFFYDNKLDKLILILKKKESEINPLFNHLGLALKYSNEGKNSESIEELKKALEIDPDNVEALMGICAQYFSNKDGITREKSLEIIEICKKLLKQLNKEENLRFLYSCFTFNKLMYLLYKDIGDAEMANEYYKAYQCFEYYNEGEKTFSEKKDIEKTLNYFKKAVDGVKSDKIPYNYNLIEKYIHLLLKNKKYEEAKEYTEKAISQAEKDNNIDKLAVYKFYIGEYYYSTDQFEKAIDYYNQGFEKEKKLDKKYYYKFRTARAYIALRKIDEASKAYDECTKLVEKGAKDIFDIASEKIRAREIIDENSNYNKSKRNIEKGSQLFLENKFNEAIECYIEALRLIPLNLECLACLSRCLYYSKKYEESFEVSLDGVKYSTFEHNFKYFDIFCSNLTNYYTEIKKDNQTALDYALLGYNKKPINKMAYNVANIYIDLKQYDKAIEYLNKCNKNESYYFESLSMLGYCYEKIDKYDKALEYYEKAYELKPLEELSKCISHCKSKL
jgi:tetratricopeptide (TPR) repeat protein